MRQLGKLEVNEPDYKTKSNVFNKTLISLDYKLYAKPIKLIFSYARWYAVFSVKPTFLAFFLTNWFGLTIVNPTN